MHCLVSGEQHGASAGMGNAEGDNCLGEEDDSGWEVATKTNTARRHKVQKEAKRAQRDEIMQVSSPRPPPLSSFPFDAPRPPAQTELASP